LKADAMQLAVPAQYLNLDPSLYTSPATWQAEREQIFLRTWQFMGPASAVAKAAVLHALGYD
jgi:phenylpropionate dioxygenase-like ring-hydroxylating dioxygenase large terminal subunit